MPPTVLLIDRDADSVAIYSLLLRHHGYDVIHAHDGETGLRLAFETGPDLVVSDLFVSHDPPADVVDRLRGDDRTADTPLIVLDSISTLAPGVPGGFGNLSRLTKPCEPSRLLHEVERLLGEAVGIGNRESA